MSQYGQVSPNYYNPIAKLNSTRAFYTYIAFVLDSESLLTSWCLYLMSHNPLEHYTDSIPFDFGTIINFCSSISFPTPIEYDNIFSDPIPISTSITGDCNAVIDVDQVEFNQQSGYIDPVAFNFGTITGECSNELIEGVLMDYTPSSPPIEQTGLFGETINNACLYSMPSNPLNHYSESTPFSFLSIDNSCLLVSSFPVPAEFTNIPLDPIPLDTSITGNCNTMIDVDQVEFNQLSGYINPVAFNFATIDNSCVAIINN